MDAFPVSVPRTEFMWLENRPWIIMLGPRSTGRRVGEVELGGLNDEWFGWFGALQFG